MADAVGTGSGNIAADDPLTRAAHVCVLVAVPLVSFNVLRAPGNLTFGDPLLLLAGLLVGAAWLKRGHAGGVIPVGLPIGAGLIFGAALIAILPPERADVVGPTLRFVITIGLLPLILMFSSATPRRVQRLIDVWLLGAFVNSVVAITDRLGATRIGGSLASYDFVALQDRATGLTNHPNTLGLVVALALPMAIARSASAGARGPLAVLTVLALIGGVAMSGSRGALLAAGGGIILLFVLAAASIRSRMGTMLIAIFVAITLLIIFSPGKPERLGTVTVERLSGGLNATDSDTQRRALLHEAVADWLERPLVGRGYSPVRPSHDIYLQLLQGGGIIALAGFLTFAAATLSRARRTSRPAAGIPSWVSGVAAGSGAGFGVWLLFGLVGTQTYDRFLYVPVGVILAIGLIHQRMMGSEHLPAHDASVPAGSQSRVPVRV